MITNDLANTILHIHDAAEANGTNVDTESAAITFTKLGRMEAGEYITVWAGVAIGYANGYAPTSSILSWDVIKLKGDVYAIVKRNRR